MQDFEKLGLFYLGRRVDLETATVLPELLLYDSRDLVTHAVCVGMTGSGKTGLCLSLIEEAAIDGVPVIAIDPKGDLGNLLLTFPGLSAQEFAPWVDEDEARRAGKDVAAFAGEEARRWREGLAEWGQDGDRIRRLRDSAEFAIYTPGSSAGQPISILASFAAPAAADRADAELMAERAGGTATSLLGLAGVDAPLRSREHTLVSALLADAWRQGRDVDLPALIQQIQSPPIRQVGVVDVDAYFPEKDRFGLAMQVNALLAAPGFDLWLTGSPLDPGLLLYAADGRPRVVIFSIAHLGDAERMFFVSLLLNQVVGWMRRLTGTTSLRAVLYMDEIAGYFPPVANPPAKGPLLTILKQGRAFGVAAVLATQNPVDLDYKGLSNTGTWFLGRLQTDRDKQRVLDGLEGAAGGGIERAAADRLLSGLGKRVFLLHNVHEPAPMLFQTRWAMSYLRGPLSRAQIAALKNEEPTPGKAAAPRPPLSAVPPTGTVPGSDPSTVRGSDRGLTPGGGRPVIPPGIQEFYVPSSGHVRYRPVILGAGQVRFSDAKLGVEEVRDVLYETPIAEGPVPVNWSEAHPLGIPAAALQTDPLPEASFDAVPAAALNPKSYSAWQKAFSRFLTENERVELLWNPDLKMSGRPGESERDFIVRIRDKRREARDDAVDALKRKYAAKRAKIEEQVRRAEAALGRETEQASHAKLQTAVSMGATLLGALLGRKAVSTGTLGRATTAARGVGRSMKEAEDIKRAEQNVEASRTRIQDLEEQLNRETQVITEQYGAVPAVERITVKPKRGQASVQFVALGWMPD